MDANVGFVRSVLLERDRVASFANYPFSIPAIAKLDELTVDPRVTFLIGENGAGKSTLIEAIAIALRFNAEGGSKNFNFANRPSESSLHQYIRVAKSWRRPRDGFFLRAETYFNVATEAERLGVLRSYGGSGHERSHGEAFMALVTNRFGDNGLYLLDEPESALSPQRQLSLLAAMHRLIRGGSQFIIATHSPILMAYPGALILRLDGDGIAPVQYEETEHFRITRDFLGNRTSFLAHLLRDD